MYVPSIFAENDPSELHDLIEQHSFATLVSQTEAEPLASHLPLLLDRHSGEHGVLLGHMARDNPQWRVADDGRVLAIFHGPHAYISPTWYQASNVVPTWNYIAVHAYGALKVERDPRRLLSIVRRYVDVYEANMEPPWTLDSVESKYLDGLLQGIVGFTIEIDRLEGKRKLNQNQSKQRRQRVIAALEKRDHDSVKIARIMADEFDGPATAKRANS